MKQKQRILTFLLLSLTFFTSFAKPAFAQFSVLPYTKGSMAYCKELLANYLASSKPADFIKHYGNNTNDVLGCGIKTGQITLEMVPLFVTYIANFMMAMIGIICVLFIVLGGYYYIYGGISDDKDKGKKTITNAIIGLIVATLAWVIVNFVIATVTS